MPTSLVATGAHLGDTVTARWRRRLAGDTGKERRHWRTKTAYYRAASELVASGVREPLSWRTIVDAVRPRGSRSTFYEVAGVHARHSLIGDLIDDGQVDSIQLALYYRREGAVQQLLDETKVWSYWPYREKLVVQYETGRLPVEAMAEAVAKTVADWAHGNPRLAETLDHAPPACAVEDLLAVLPGRLSALRAADMLTDSARGASRPSQSASQTTGGAEKHVNTPWQGRLLFQH